MVPSQSINAVTEPYLLPPLEDMERWPGEWHEAEQRIAEINDLLPD